MKKKILRWLAIVLLPAYLHSNAQNDRQADKTSTIDSLRPELHRLLSFDSSQQHFTWSGALIRAMTSNLDSNYNKILALKNRYQQLVPAGYRVYLFFHTATGNKYGETYDITIRRSGKKGKLRYTRPFEPHNDRSMSIIRTTLGWDYGTIMEIRRLLKETHCSGIENSEVVCIYYLKGIPDYRYLFFPKDLTSAELEKYSDRQRFFFYKKNIVLEVNKKVSESLPQREPS